MSPGSVLSVRRLPRLRAVPVGVESDGDLACELASAYGLTADPTQASILEDWLWREADGKWSCAVCWLAMPRQNGKNACIEIRELYGMVELGERFLHTAHEVKTARKAFRRLLSFFENPVKYPELSSMVKEIRKTNGQEAIFLVNGGSVELIARSKGSGRGFDGIDVLVIDEAQELSDDEQAALLPTISAATQGNPQVIFTGTPPNPEKPEHGVVFRRVRMDGIEGSDPRLCLHDFGAPDGPLPDINDWNLLLSVNPALGLRLSEAEVERERRLMSAEKFAHERLGWWGDPANLLVRGDIDLEKWARLADPRTPPPTGPTVIAVDVPPDRSATSLAVAWRTDSGRIAVMVEVLRGTVGAVKRIRVLAEKKPLDICLHAGGPAGSLLADLTAAGVEVTPVTTQAMAQATGGLVDLVKNSGIQHLDQTELNDAVASGRLRNTGDARYWDRRDLTDISPLVAVTLAAHSFTAHEPEDYDLLSSVFGDEEDS